MGIEIERKFLVKGDAWRTPGGTRYVQGYLRREKGRTIRVRIGGGRAFLTIKGPSTGASRPEFEYPIPVADAEQLMAFCEGARVEKIRHEVPFAGLTWEVDEFLGENQGLVVAEVELEREDQPIEKPPWVGEEVTGDPRYYNASLAVRPYRSW